MTNRIEVIVPEELISNKIYIIRNQKVMLDRDLASLYEGETKVLKQAVKRKTELIFNHRVKRVRHKDTQRKLNK